MSHEPTEEEIGAAIDALKRKHFLNDALTAANAIRDRRIRAETADIIDALVAREQALVRERDALRAVTDDKVERAARAMCKLCGSHPSKRFYGDGWVDNNLEDWMYYVEEARAALTAALDAPPARQSHAAEETQPRPQAPSPARD